MADRDPEAPGRRRRPERVGDLLPEAARQLGLEDELRLARAISTWDALVAERVLAAVGSCRLVALEPDAIVVAVDEPIVAAELRMRAMELLGAFSAAPGGTRARHLRLRIDGPGVPAVRNGPPRIIRTPPPPGVVASPSRPDARRWLHEARSLAVRLQLKLGAVTEQDKLADSPDSIIVVEPSVGSVARSKGNLYLLVTSRTTGNRAREATHMVADTIRNEYYYDESAGIRQCLTKVMGVANKRLAHQRDKYGMAHEAEGSGPIGVAVAVVRGREMYVATVGPAEAYLIRQARLSTLPDPNRDRGLPAEDLEPEVWRGELTVGDSLCLVSANVVARTGPDALKDALVTLHPQSAIEHLHARFVAADGKGSDGALAFEATEVGATHKARTLVPVRPAEPLAGAPDKSPIPLADTVTATTAAIGAGATRARSAARQRLPARHLAHPGPAAPSQARVAQGHRGVVADGDAAPCRGRAARVRRHRRRPRLRRLRLGRPAAGRTRRDQVARPQPRRRSTRQRRRSTRSAARASTSSRTTRAARRSC